MGNPLLASNRDPKSRLFAIHTFSEFPKLFFLIGDSDFSQSSDVSSSL